MAAISSRDQQYQQALERLAAFEWILHPTVAVALPSSGPEPESPKIHSRRFTTWDEEMRETGYQPDFQSVRQIAFNIRNAAFQVFQLRKDIPCQERPANEEATLALLPRYIKRITSWDKGQGRLFAVYQNAGLTDGQLTSALNSAATPLPLQR